MIQAKPKLPYVYFSVKSKQTKDEQGHVVDALEYTAHVVTGPKDEREFEAEAWLKTLLEKGQLRAGFDDSANEYATVWYPTFKGMFDAFKAGEEMTHPGTPLRTILAFMKTEVAQCERSHIYSLEQLADANEEMLGAIGIGGRALRDKARQLLASKADNRQAEELAACHVEIEALKQRIEQFIAAGHSPNVPRVPRVRDKELAA